MLYRNESGLAEVDIVIATETNVEDFVSTTLKSNVDDVLTNDVLEDGKVGFAEVLKNVDAVEIGTPKMGMF